MLRRLVSKTKDDSWRGGYKGFSENEMKCKGSDNGKTCDCGGKGLPSHSFMVKLVKIRKRVGSMVITSGYRCASHNRRVGGASNSAHPMRVAADIKANGKKALLIIIWGFIYGMTGFGVSQKGSFGSRFVHLDCKPGSFRLWTY